MGYLLPLLQAHWIKFIQFDQKNIYYPAEAGDYAVEQGCATHGPRATIRPSRPVNVALDDGRQKKSIYLAICTVYDFTQKSDSFHSRIDHTRGQGRCVVTF